jgi:glycosyltransferase involved in cell wall biosynthesis
MKILQIALYDRSGGACIAGYRQHQALRLAGVDSQLFVRFKVTTDVHATPFQPPPKPSVRIPRLMRRGLRNFSRRRAGLLEEMFTASSEHGSSLLAALPSADVVNVQFAWDFLDYPSFFRLLPPEIPVVVTMHEMGTFTGGCSYAGSCVRFTEACGNCPKLRRRGPCDLSSRGWQEREQAFGARRKGGLHFVANSDWTYREARRSSLLKDYPITTIHLGIDTDVFRPLDRSAAREAFGIPGHGRVVCFAAASQGDPRKGLKHLADALAGMREKPFLLVWGKSVPESVAAIPHLHLGNIDSEHLMAVAYNAADIFVMPSLEEAFGQTALEAIACGTPVVAFAAGGIPETVRNEETGLLASVGDTLALQANIERLLSDERLWEHCSKEGVKLAHEEFSYELNARKYIELYEALCERSSE